MTAAASAADMGALVLGHHEGGPVAPNGGSERASGPRVPTVGLRDGAGLVRLGGEYRRSPAFENAREVVGAHQLDFLVRVAVVKDGLYAITVEHE